MKRDHCPGCQDLFGNRKGSCLDNDITITTDSNFKTTIICEKAKFNIIGKSGEDFSYLPMIERNESIVLSQYTLKEVIRQTIFSISDNDNNKLMSGELFEINGEEMRSDPPLTDIVFPSVRSI